MSSYNPFNPNSVVAPNLFAGRALQVDDICKKLSQVRHGMPSCFFIYGERGIGKTALARLIRFVSAEKDEKLYSLNFLSSYYPVERGQTLGSVLQESMNKLTENMNNTVIEKIGKKLGNLFSNGKFEIGAFGINIGVETKEKELQSQITIKDQTVSILSSIIKEAGIVEPKTYDGILIVIDEIHNLKDISSAASILRNISTSLNVENLGYISFLLIGYEEDVKKFFEEDSSSRRTFDLIKLSVMPKSEAVEVLTKGFNEIPIKYDPISLDSGIDAAGGYPHSIQKLGYNLIENDKDDNIDISDWKNVIYKTAQELQAKDFANMYTFEKKQTERDKVLIYLAKSPDSIHRGKLVNEVQTTNLSRCITELKEKGAIREDVEGNISLHSQLLRTAILLDLFLREYKQKKSSN